MTTFGKNSLATLLFTIKWEDSAGKYEDSYLARRVNVWRDIFPIGLEKALTGCVAGDSVTLNYEPGKFMEWFYDRKVLTLKRNQICFLEEHACEPELVKGRYYPQGVLRGVSQIFPQNTTPCRLLEFDDEKVVVDCNHPIAKIPLEMTVTIQHVEDKRSDTGGELNRWSESICNYGPGMQTMPDGHFLELSEKFFSRTDEKDDAVFYGEPRIISHIDGQARANLTDIYSRFLKPEMQVLDLMSSVDSHLPEDTELNVFGLGMNSAELEQNGRLFEYVVHDLNKEPDFSNVVEKASDADEGFDLALCSLSIEYLTKPLEVLQSVHGQLKDDGAMLVSFSDRWFPTKAISGWRDMHPFERSGLVLQWLKQAGFKGKAGAISMRNDWRPTDDKYYMETRGVSDPVFVVWAYKK
ncbi:MAG: hypothetical protein ACNI27_15660 [Desulfovibrio sp.]